MVYWLKITNHWNSYFGNEKIAMFQWNVVERQTGLWDESGKVILRVQCVSDTVQTCPSISSLVKVFSQHTRSKRTLEAYRYLACHAGRPMGNDNASAILTRF